MYTHKDCGGTVIVRSVVHEFAPLTYLGEPGYVECGDVQQSTVEDTDFHCEKCSLIIARSEIEGAESGCSGECGDVGCSLPKQHFVPDGHFDGTTAELDAVMVSVDKWFEDGDSQLALNPATRAAAAREIALRAIESAKDQIKRLEESARQLFVINDRNISVVKSCADALGVVINPERMVERIEVLKIDKERLDWLDQLLGYEQMITLFGKEIGLGSDEGPAPIRSAIDLTRKRASGG